MASPITWVDLTRDSMMGALGDSYTHREPIYNRGDNQD
jgi:hypothetical protein